MRLPLTILSGYLGAGKTTLVNRLLTEDHGLRLLVLVNDFGAVNLDAAAIARAGGDTVELTNGCVCCSTSQDLFAALDTALARPEAPDHIVVEASGVADPAAIAATAIAEPDIAYGGIVTLVDAQNAPGLLDDPDIGPHVAQQIKSADLTLLTRTAHVTPALLDRLGALNARQVTPLDDTPLAPLVFGFVPRPDRRTPVPHPAYARWQIQSDTPISRAALGDMLADRPAGLYRLKGDVLTSDGGYSVHVVGQYVEARRCRDIERTRLVGIGPAARLSAAEMDAWWQVGARKM